MVRSLGILMGLILLSSTVAEARPYRLQWDRNNDGLTTGYRVYYGTAPGAYQPSNGIDVGNVQEFTVDLTPGGNYYFSVRAYSSSVLGPASSELRFTVPLGPSIAVSTASAPPGATITATVTDGPGSRQDWVGFFPSGAPSTGWTDWKYLNGTRTAPTSGMSNGSVSFNAPSTPGSYEVRFYSGNQVLLASSVPITVVGGASVTVPASVTAGQNFTVAVSNGPGNRNDFVALYSSTNTNPSSYLDWKYLNGSQSLPATGTRNANVSFAAPTQTGQYFVRFMLNNGTVLATSSTINVAVVAGTSVTPSATTIAAGSTLYAQVANGPGGRNDWVGLFAVGASNGSPIAQYYLNGSVNPPSTGMTSASVPFIAPNQAGQYNLRFFPNNGLTATATSATITVTTTSTPPPSNPPPAPPPSGTPTVTASVVSVAPGGNVTAQVTNAPGSRTDWVGLFPVGASPTEFVDWFYLNGSKVAPATAVATANIPFRINSSGQYNLRLLSNNGFTVLSTSATITASSAPAPAPPPTGTPSVTPSATIVARGSLLTVTVTNGPGGRYDWVGIYSPTLSGADFAEWLVLNGTTVAPSIGVANTSFPLRVPSTPGTYVLRFYANNSYTALLANSVTIKVQ